MSSVYTIFVVYFIVFFSILVAGICMLDSLRCRYPTSGVCSMIFIALTLSLVVLMALTPLIDYESEKEERYLMVLISFAFILPIIMFIVVVASGEHRSYLCNQQTVVKTVEKFSCDPLSKVCMVMERDSDVIKESSVLN